MLCIRPDWSDPIYRMLFSGFLGADKGMRRTLISLSILAGVLTLAGCANPFGKQTYIRDKSGDYVNARAAEPIQLPEDSNAREFGDILVIPDIARNITSCLHSLMRLVRYNDFPCVKATASVLSAVMRLTGFLRVKVLPRLAETGVIPCLERRYYYPERPGKRCC